MADDGNPSRIRWHQEGDGLTGHAGTLDPCLFRIYEPGCGSPEHMLTARLPSMESKLSYGTEAEVKRQAEDWLGEFAASLGAVFPPAREHARDWDDRPVSRTPAIPAGPWEVTDGG